ncbi:gsl3942 [Gloeobacter violaceus PCC 7421]|uniref:Gsl3942 protein n=1 Tax=Gloeobacter violaceus (strain ATCC 29082 / PCC 7421) TaxID=251221 RepID=Q7NED8_GLOVI|nr:gsl3942 [Gloeobacter violaceus PCC 7421]
MPIDPVLFGQWRSQMEAWQTSQPLRFEVGVRRVERCLRPGGRTPGLVAQLQEDYTLLQIAWMVAEAARRQL